MKTTNTPQRLRLAVLLIGLTCVIMGLAWLFGEMIITEQDVVQMAPAWLIYLLTAGFDAGDEIQIAYTLIFIG